MDLAIGGLPRSGARVVSPSTASWSWTQARDMDNVAASMAEEADEIRRAILWVADDTKVDPRFILAVIVG